MEVQGKGEEHLNTIQRPRRGHTEHPHRLHRGFTEDSQRTGRKLTEDSQRTYRTHSRLTEDSQRTRRRLTENSQRTHRGLTEDSQWIHRDFTEDSAASLGFAGHCPDDDSHAGLAADRSRLPHFVEDSNPVFRAIWQKTGFPDSAPPVVLSVGRKRGKQPICFKL